MEEHKEKEEYVCLATYMGAVTSPLTMLKVMVAVNCWGASLNRFAFPLGGSGKCSNSTQATSSIEAVQTFLPSSDQIACTSSAKIYTLRKLPCKRGIPTHILVEFHT